MATLRNPIDNFILARLQKENLKFSPEASKETLIRRVSLDLIGLPPTLDEIDTFLADDRPDAYERLVERLLASPHYGERWARPWLDLARYADTNGYEADRRRTMWKYRDWVIDALNRDMPFDRFTIEQIAGDMLPGATQGTESRDRLPSQHDVQRGGRRRQRRGSFRGARRSGEHDRLRFGWGARSAAPSATTTSTIRSRKRNTTSSWRSSRTRRGIPQLPRHRTKFKEPELDLATPEQEQARKKWKAEIDALETKLKTQTPELAKAQSAWERKLLEAVSDWEQVQVSSMTAISGTTKSRA